MALDDYFSDPSQECLARLFDAVNAMDISSAPILTRNERIIMRVTERKDIFSEKFSHPHAPAMTASKKPSQGSTGSGGGNRDTIVAYPQEGAVSSRTSFDLAQRPRTDSLQSRQSDSGGISNGWVSEDGMHEGSNEGINQYSHATPQPSQRGRRSIDSNSTSSHARREDLPIPVIDTSKGNRTQMDTHFHPTTIIYRGHTLPIKVPLSTFSEEVGDVSIWMTTYQYATRLILTLIR